MIGFRCTANSFVQSGATISAIDVYRNAYLFTCRIENNGYESLQIGDVVGLWGVVDIQSPGRVALCQSLNGEVL